MTVNVFPADRHGAREHLATALHLRPQSSELWFAYAENDLYAGQLDRARTALSVADSLDPNYPGQVLKSAQLWEVMGESERAKSAVRRIAAWGGDWQKDSVTTSLALGFSPTEVYEFIDGNHLEAEQFAKILPLLKSSVPSENVRLYNLISPQMVEEYRAKVLELLISPLAFDALTEAWGHDLATDGTLTTPPFAEALPLGWQSPGKDKVQASWLNPESRGMENGALSLRAADGNFSWIMYRLPLASRSRTRTITLQVKATDPAAMFWMRALPAELSTSGKATPLTPNEWTSIQLELKPSHSDSVITIVLEGRNLSSPAEVSNLRLTDSQP